MKSRITIAFAIVLIIASFTFVGAQEGADTCSPEDIAARVDRAVDAYQTGRATATNMDTALNALNSFQLDLNRVRDLCENVASGPSQSTGSGTMSDPYVFGTVGDTGEGFTIQVTGFIRPADQIIRAANMFNDRPQAGEEYIIVEVTVQCDRNFTGRCETNYFDFELVGDSGTIYEYSWVSFDSKLEVALFAGGTGSGALPFLIRADDTNLRLLYRANMFQDAYVVYEASPSLANGIEITASTSINVRSGPGTNHTVTTTLTPNAPVVAFGRNSDGTWVQTAVGWVFVELITTSGNVESLPVTAQ